MKPMSALPEARRELDIMHPASSVQELRAYRPSYSNGNECAEQTASQGIVILPAMCWRERQAVNDENWLERLQTLLVRFSAPGLGGDMAGLSLIELWGLYRFLSRLADG